eukprot:TRINITY_DN1351_c0_g1_i1.p1 TRINITY_DN1351_c0_g1~~TRINITY_DN1351_c0_g1_i1.p1  ORF type:complete len:537 (+),score=217.45 TRINITY_DN1351_c0_g1_i1:55-1611(+)
MGNKAIKALGRTVETKQARSLFQEYDKDGSTYLNKEEAMRFLEEFAKSKGNEFVAADAEEAWAECSYKGKLFFSHFVRMLERLGVATVQPEGIELSVVSDLTSADSLSVSSQLHPLVIEVISCAHVPKSDLIGWSDPYVEVHVLDRNGCKKCETVCTLPRKNVADPVWRSFRSLAFDEESGDTLEFLLRDSDRASKDDTIGKGTIAVGHLRQAQESGDAVCEVTIDVVEEFASRHAAPCTLRVRKVKQSSDKKRIFFIRHGLSKWNKAQAEANLVGLMNFDHPLDERGIAQAQGLNSRWTAKAASPSSTASSYESDESRIQCFLQAEQIYASPLTRALQTALVVLREHRCLTQHGIALLPSCREIKGIGGLDTLGKACGDDIKSRVREELLLSPEEVNEVMAVNIDTSAVESEWWTSDRDAADELEARIRDFWCTLKWGEFSTCIVVGHSLFFRALCKKFSSPELLQRNPALAKEKMNNAALLCVDVDFSGELPVIEDANFMFGTGFATEGEEEEGAE